MCRVLLIIIVVTGPVNYTVDSVHIVWIIKDCLCVPWNIESVKLFQHLLEGKWLNSVVDGDDAGTCSLQEVHMTGFDEGGDAEFEVSSPLVGDWLGQYTEDWLVGLVSCVVAHLVHHWLTFSAAQVILSVTFYTTNKLEW